MPACCSALRPVAEKMADFKEAFKAKYKALQKYEVASRMLLARFFSFTSFFRC